LAQGRRFAFAPALLAIVSLVGLFVVLEFFDTNVQRSIETSEQALGIGLAALAVAGLVIAIAWSGWRALKIEDTLRGVMIETAKTSSLVFIILLGAAMLTAAFRAFGGEELVKDFLQTLPGGFWTQFVIVMAVIFLLGFFLDFIEIAVVVVPIVAPILLMDPSANITAVWLGVMIGLNIQSSFLTPPFGFALFYLRGVAPKEVKTTDIYKGVVPFIGLQLVALGIVGATPPLVNYLPNRISLLSDNAPPPVNPLLQSCVDELLARDIRAESDDLRAAIAAAQGLDLSGLPRSLRGDLEDAFEEAGSVFGHLDTIDTAQAAVSAATPAYRPLHTQVRAIERDIRKDEERIEHLEDELDALRFAEAPDPAERVALQQEISRLQAEIESLHAQVPTDWEERHTAFAALLDTETTARRAFRRAMDDAVEPVTEVIARLRLTDEMAALDGKIGEVRAALAAEGALSVEERIDDLPSVFRDVDVDRDLTGAFRDARRVYRDDEPDPAEIDAALVEAEEAFAEELEWRQAAVREVLPGLEAYNSALSGTIGLRQQERLDRDRALEVAACRSQHRDISLHF
ncbi:MAG: SLC13 family permease, partial [Pikeienuella sp.]